MKTILELKSQFLIIFFVCLFCCCSLLLVYLCLATPVYGNLRLVDNGKTGHYITGGRLEVDHKYRWTPFCITGFDNHDADMACKMLGFSAMSRLERVGNLGYEYIYSKSSVIQVARVRKVPVTKIFPYLR